MSARGIAAAGHEEAAIDYPPPLPGVGASVAVGVGGTVAVGVAVTVGVETVWVAVAVGTGLPPLGPPPLEGGVALAGMADALGVGAMGV